MATTVLKVLNLISTLHKKGYFEANRYKGSRFRGIVKERFKASDHCPEVIEMDI